MVFFKKAILKSLVLAVLVSTALTAGTGVARAAIATST